MTEHFCKYSNVKIKMEKYSLQSFPPSLYSGSCNPFLRKSENTTFTEWCIITSHVCADMPVPYAVSQNKRQTTEKCRIYI